MEKCLQRSLVREPSASEPHTSAGVEEERVSVQPVLNGEQILDGLSDTVIESNVEVVEIDMHGGALHPLHESGQCLCGKCLIDSDIEDLCGANASIDKLLVGE